MLRSFIASLMLLFIVGCATSVPQATPQFPTYNDIRQSTVLVTIGEDGSCSGVVVSAVHVLTAAHCEGPDMKVDGLPALIIKKNREADLMLLLTPTRKPAMSVAAKRPALDTRVILSGYPLGLGLVLTEGRMQEFSVEHLPHYMLVTAQGIFGNSGGPVVALNRETMEWEIVGIASRLPIVGFGSPVTHLMIVVNTETINEFLKVKNG